MDSQSEAIARAALLPLWSRYSRPLRVTFPVLNSRLDIAHTLGAVPDGYVLVWADAAVIATPGTLWTPTTAYLQAGSNNAHAIVIFFTLREAPTNA